MRYVALLRGVMPTNPTTRSENLRRVFEDLGFERVATVIGSGNVIFDSPARNAIVLETRIEEALSAQLGFKTVALVRSRVELEALAKRNPFAGVEDTKPNYLLVTFLKNRRTDLCTVVDLSETRTPEFMTRLEKQHGKALTSRTWKTVIRILKKMDAQ